MTDFTQYCKSASDLLDHLKIKEIPIDVQSVAEKLEIKINDDLPIDSDIVGELTFNNGLPIIRINPAQNQYEQRRRFTIAHEIGHRCLHSSESKKGFRDSRKSMSRTESYWDSKEYEANNFAAELLMPSSEIYSIGKHIIKAYKDAAGAKKIPISVFTGTMAQKFQVSNKAMEYRLKNLRILRN
uniref:IrrE N-terminal-like domain-containing protein n=1 Tax=Candidatus Kentrum sp. UNK TaxID=2126344 RepID=A0A451AWD3_9GAMM|nr:MAG: protein of unknown function (DUF955) [Candidatus Kentron sp. UNK]VFK70360.1 MAG: protein of unknown function (DUF955) [Candidatus Kentron sp. UNK]